ncbi:MAG: hypothetical protein JW932_04350 [Deltaproteobacteria bacterium]|nr:hypothetical protein [Deltaproteobacteria bacterium]
MEIIFKRSLGTLILFLLIWCFMVSSTSAKEDGSVSAAVADARKAGVPEETVSGILALGYEHGLQADEIVEFLDVTRSAHENGFSLRSFMGKIEEGLAKGVEARNISQVLHQELDRFQFTYQLASQTMSGWKAQHMGLRPEDLARMAGTLAMGLTKTDMEVFFSGVPKAPMNQVANALEFMAGLIQSGLHQDEARDIVYAGMDSGFFARPDWRLSAMVRAAIQKDIPNDQVIPSALNVVKGKIDVVEAFQSLDLDPGAVQWGPSWSVSNGSDSGPSNGQGLAGGQGNNQEFEGPSESSGGAGSDGSGGGNGSDGHGEDGGSDGDGNDGSGGNEGSDGDGNGGSGGNGGGSAGGPGR